MPISCPKLEGMTLVEPDQDLMGECEHFLEMTAELKQFGYQLYRGGTLLKRPSDSYPGTALYNEWLKGENLGLMAHPTEMDRKMLGNNDPFDLSLLMYARHLKWLSVDMALRDNKDCTINSMLTTVYQDTADTGHFELLDMLTCCKYRSEGYEYHFDPVKTLPAQAEKVVKRIFAAVKNYMNDIDFAALTDIVPQYGYCLKRYPVIKDVHENGIANDNSDLFEIFPILRVKALPSCGVRDMELPYSYASYTYNKDLAAARGYPTLDIHGTIAEFAMLSPGIQYNEKDTDEYHVVERPDERFKFVPSDELKPVGKNGHFSSYTYKDKFDNGVLIQVYKRWWETGNGRITSINIIPPLPLGKAGNGAGAEGPAGQLISIDLSPLGLGEYRNIFRTETIPFIGALDKDTNIYSACSELDELITVHFQLGIMMAESMFNEPGLVKNIVLTYFEDDASGMANKQVKNTIFIKARAKFKNWGMAFHESVHLIDYKYDLKDHAKITKLIDRYLKTNSTPVFCKMVNPDIAAYCGEDALKEIHKWLNPAEFIAITFTSVMDSGLAEKFSLLNTTEQNEYIEILTALANAIKERLPNGMALPIWRKINNTIEHLNAGTPL